MSMPPVNGAFVVLAKDIRLEWRTRSAVNALLMFVLSAVFLIVYAIGGSTLDEVTTSALIWTVVIFSAAIGMSRSFIVEEEQQTVTLLRLHAAPASVYLGKLLFNFALLLGVNLLAVMIFVFLLNLDPGSPGLMATTVLLGSLALAGATTLLSAIVSKTRGGAAVLPILLFPLLLPLLGAAVRATTMAFEGDPLWSLARNHLITLVAFAGVTITASLLLFDQVWND
jgi:heme exporter protein B